MAFERLRTWYREHPRRTWLSVMLFAHLLGFVSSLDALMSTRTAPGAVAWIVSLNTFPVAAVPMYWVFGRSRFHGYVIGRREDDNQLYNDLQGHMSLVHPFRVTLPPDGGKVEAIERLAKMPMVVGNEVELLIDGEATFRSIFEGIEAARESVLVQFYIVRDDDIGREFQALLMRKAREGVRVRFLYDEIGSYRLPASYLADMSEAGVQVQRFHSTRGSGNRFQLNFRNHRKVVIVDGRDGWLGGLNVGDEYLGRSSHFGDWRDTHLRMTGPATLCLQLSFVEDWHWATGEILELDWTPQPANGQDVPVLVLPSGPADRFETASLMVQHAISSARERLWISSPYFVPDEGVLGALKLAALRGVDVRVLVPERPDNILTYYAAYAFVAPLLEAGVHIHRYQAGFLHGKSMLIDDVASAVGTVNLDNRSFRLNFEITAWVLQREFAQQMDDMFRRDFERSREMTLVEVLDKPWWFRAASRAAYLTAPVL
ncbi:cardiolipin synthase [Pseudazoarcus pumilus]|uniref:Cardiolipin synthase A n=1 Tax=Pseudazoarcus pumilus TaxID=2067960 RepID=A0A2I6S989_9RHOO|nr:cardiolipin synthase [Pseudazoarcus pumilus]AUN95822.1 cardiolipin synthase [Pseudazoarcus pumilus]